eukprot:PLAT1667.1.p1 GENE.PLAT1667.1~~PLAT1667.1.p1  ORF type:complete len:366 (-),score=112.40 PLAT1667.1:58-1077(-)
MPLRPFSLLSAAAVVLLALCAVPAAAEDMYCGEQNCYAILQVEREATSREIRKAYREATLLWHPDRNSDPSAKPKFLAVAKAYEVLKDDSTREQYDYYLDHPEEALRNQYYYYKYTYAPQSDPRLVIGGFIAAISALLYAVQWNRYHEAVRYFKTSKTVVARAKRLAAERLAAEKAAAGGSSVSVKKKQKQRSAREEKERLSELEAEAIEEVVSEVDIQGGYAKPRWTDILAVKLVMLPVWAVKGVAFQLRWFLRFTIQKQPYGQEERIYLTRRALQMPQAKWDSMKEEERKDMLKRELWHADALEQLKKEQEAEMRAKFGGRYKRYLRWTKKMKNGRR